MLALTVEKFSDYLSRVINARGALQSCPGHINDGEGSTSLDEGSTVGRRGAGKCAHDLSRVIDAVGDGQGCAGHVYWGVAATDVEKALILLRQET